jgi:hypothetical protein
MSKPTKIKKNVRNLYRSISAFKKGYQPGTNIVKDAIRDLVTDCHSISARQRNHFSQLFIVHGVNDVHHHHHHWHNSLV